MNIAVFGTGLLGYSLSERLLQSDHKVFVYNRTPQKAEPLSRLGATILDDPGALKDAQVLLLVLSDYNAIQEVINSVADFKECVVIQMGTIAPHESVLLFDEVRKKNGEYFECPVLGSRKEAQEGSLLMMVGGSKKQYEDWKELLQCLGPNPRYIGAVGKAAALKLSLNQLIASHIAAFAFSLGLTQRHQIEVNDFMDVLRESSLYAPMLDKKLPKMIERNFSNPNFPVKHLRKDVALIKKEGENSQLSTKHLNGITRILEQAQAEDLGDKDYSAIYNVINPID